MVDSWGVRALAIGVIGLGTFTSHLEARPSHATNPTSLGLCTVVCAPRGNCILCGGSCSQVGGIETTECVWACSGNCGSLAE